MTGVTHACTGDLIVTAVHQGVASHVLRSWQGGSQGNRIASSDMPTATFLLASAEVVPSAAWSPRCPNQAGGDISQNQGFRIPADAHTPASLSFRQNLTSAASNADDLQMVLTGNVTTPVVYALFDLLRQNASGVYVYATIDLGNDLLLYSLPDGVLRLVGYKPPPTGLSAAYTFCTSSCDPPPRKPWWEQIWEGLVSVVTAFVTSAVVLAVTAFRMIVAVLSQVGSWVAQAVATAAAVVASAVQAAAKVLGQVVDWVLSWIVQRAHSLMDALVRPMVSMLTSWVADVAGALSRILQVGDTDSLDVSTLYGAVFQNGIVVLAQALSLAVEVTIGIILAVSVILPGAAVIASAVKAVLASALEEAVEHWLGLSVSTAIGAIIGAIVPATDPFWTTTSAMGTFFLPLAVMLIQELYVKWDSGKFKNPLMGDYLGLSLALLGFFLSLGVSLSGTTGAIAHVVNVFGAILSGIGVIITLGCKSWNDDLGGAIGFLDEGVSAASFGFATVQAFRS